MGWQTGTTPCQPTPAAKPGAIPETCPSGEEPPEATPTLRVTDQQAPDQHEGSRP
jgi:hypothetical protein